MYKVVLPLLILASSASAAKIDGLEFCVGPYALCSTSYCTNIPGDSKHARCTCEGPFEGLNLGNTTCKARSESLISTFSDKEQFTSAIQPPLYTFECKGENAAPWADCLDAPCSTETGAVVCKCPLNKASGNFYLGEKCPKNAKEMKSLCSQLRSTGALSSGMQTLGSVIGSFYGNPPNVTECKSAMDA